MSANDPVRPHSSRRTFLTAGSATLIGGASAGALASASSSADTALRAAIASYRAAVSVEVEADAAQALAAGRFDGLGGYPKMSDALLQTEHDRRVFSFHATSCTGAPEYRRRFNYAMVAYLRRNPCVRYVECSRPATIEDGFTPGEVAEGYYTIGKTERVAWPEAQARANEIISAWDAYETELGRRREVSGLDRAEAAQEAASAARRSASATLVAAPAETMEGAQLKLALLLSLYAGRPDLDEELSETSPNITLDYRLGLSVARDLAILTGRV